MTTWSALSFFFKLIIKGAFCFLVSNRNESDKEDSKMSFFVRQKINHNGVVLI